MTAAIEPSASSASSDKARTRTGRWKLFAVIAVCAAPVVASYLTYYVIKPQSRTNYGDLIDPRTHPVPALGGTTLDGKPVELDAYRGKWLLVKVGSADCDQACNAMLFAMRQLRLMQGKEMERIERVWLINDSKPVDTMLIRQYDGMRFIRVSADKTKAWLPVDGATTSADHFYLIDPLGNLMMRFPKDADPSRVKRDLSRLLTASRIG